MWRHYLVMAVRNLIRNRSFVLINLSGLATGIAFCILAGLFVWQEWHFDLFHKNVNRIYRVIQETQTQKGLFRSALIPENIGPLLKDFVPEIEQGIRIWDGDECRVKKGNGLIKEHPYFVDPEFLTVFSFPLLRGNQKTALRTPNGIVITEALAQKCFGNEDPMGKELILTHAEWRYEPKVFIVQGVVQNPSLDSSLQFNLLLPLTILPQVAHPDAPNKVEFRNLPPNRMYVLLAAHADFSRVQARVADFINLHRGTDKRLQNLTLKLQPFREVHFDRQVTDGLGSPGNPVSAYILVGIALGVLLIACINFVNLSIARSTSRAVEVGVRKMMGAQRWQLIRQFWGESMLLSCLAFALGLGLAEFLLPMFNTLIQVNLTMHYELSWIVFLGSLTLLLGLMSGIYPAVVLSRYDVVAALKSRFRIDGKHWFGRGLMVFQFAVSALLVVIAVGMSNQLSYVHNKDLGFDKEQVVIVSSDEWKVPGNFWEARRIRLQGLNAYGQALMTYAGVMGVTRVDQFASQDFGPLPVQLALPNREPIVAETFPIGYNFLNVMDIELLSGRDFSPAFQSDIRNAVIVNETLVKELVLKNPLNTALPFRMDKLVGQTAVVLQNPSIIGVVKDFHFQSLHQPMRPLILHLNPQAGWNLFVRIRPNGAPQTLAFMKSKWAEITGGAPFNCEFLDEKIHRQYQVEMRWEQIVRYASLFAIWVACLGVLGLTAQAVVRRTKEIGIRKILGASINQIATLLSKEFVWMVLTANVVALPLAYYVLEHWLQDFAYRINLGIGVLSLGVLLTMGPTIATVSFQALRAARSNPVDSLRNE